MLPKRMRKPTLKALQSLPDTLLLDDDQQLDPLPNTSRNTSPNESLSDEPALPFTETLYPLEPLLSTNDTQDAIYVESAIQKASRESTAEDKDDNRLT